MNQQARGATFRVHAGLAVPLPSSQVDTDTIVRMERCAQYARAELGPWAFESLRTRPDGSADPQCVFNDPRFAGASILVAGANFGCGSSREMAVWALQGMGLHCVLAESFGDIFEANGLQNGLLPVRLPQASVRGLLQEAAAGTLRLRVDLLRQVVEGSAQGPLHFAIDELRRTLLLQGLDTLGLALSLAPATACWQAADRLARPWVYAAAPPGAAGAAPIFRPPEET